jgi:endoglucanase
MRLDRELKLLREICSLPTAPFREGRVLAYLDAFVKARPQLKLTRDRYGNTLLAPRRAAKARGRRLVLMAHVDHPGFIAREQSDGRTVIADFHGGVLPELMAGAGVLFYQERGDLEVRGKVVSAIADERGRAKEAVVRVSKPVPPGTPGMFDVGEARFAAKRMHSRVCDDLAGVGAAIVALDRLSRSAPAANVCALLTRAEEQGFIGAIGAVRDGTLLRRDDLVISIETSAEQPVALQGNGVVVRVGDRVSVFDTALTGYLVECAERLAKKSKTFAHQRALMPGGACEATVLCAHGYTAAAACVPLGNYHNMDKARKRIAAEHIHVGDWKCMVSLFEEAGRSLATFDAEQKSLKKRLDDRFDQFEKLLG